MGKRVAPLLILIVVAAGLAVHWEHGPILSSDDHGQYLLHARNIIEGKPYADIGFLHSKHSTLIAPIAEPPLVPYAIAALFKLTGAESVPAVRFLEAAFLLLFGWCAYRVFVEADGPAPAAAAAVCALVLPLSAHSLDAALADLPYCAFLWLACLLAARVNGPLGSGRIAALGLAGAACFASRMAALPLLPAAAMMLLLRPRREKPAWIAVLAIWLAAAYYVMFAQPGAEVLGGESVGRGLGRILSDAAQNLKVIVIAAGSVLPVATPWMRLTQALQGLALLAAAGGFVLALWPRISAGASEGWIGRIRAVSFVEWAMLWTFAMLVALPVRDARYAWALLPFFAAGLTRAAVWVVNRYLNLPARIAQHADTGWLVAAPLLLAAGGLIVSTAPPEVPTFAENQDLQRALQALKKDIKSGEQPRVAIFAPRVFTWHTKIPATGLYTASFEETFADLKAKQITHVVTGDGGVEEERVVHFRNLVTSRPAMFPLVFAGGKFAVHRAILAQPPPSASAPAATSIPLAASGK